MDRESKVVDVTETGIINKATLIPLSVALVSAVTIMGLVLSASNRLIRMEVAIDLLVKDVNDIKAGIGDRWTRTKMQHWADILEARNEGIIEVPKVPGN